MLTQELLDILWDFREPAASEERFRQAVLSGNYDAVEQVELATQLARALGLQGRFDEAKAVLSEVADSAEAQHPAVRVRLLLERGRLLNSSGHPGLSITVFEQAATLGETSELYFSAVDALHMLAIVDPGHEKDWTLKALDLATAAEEPRTRRWAVSLHNNRGWTLHKDGDYWGALHEFRSAKICADESGTEEQQRTAQRTVARCLRSMERYQDALEIQQELAEDNPDDRYVQEELRKLHATMNKATENKATEDAERTEHA